jgi:hypothetical protein
VGERWATFYRELTSARAHPPIATADHDLPQDAAALVQEASAR